MNDYQFLSYQTLASLREVSLASTSGVPTLDIRGSSFSDVTEILINGFSSPEYVVVSSTRILAEIPVSQRDGSIRSVRVKTSQQREKGASIVAFDANVNRVSSGWLKLAQSVLKVLLTTQGSDIFNPTVGGGLFSIVGTAGSQSSFISQAALAVQNTQSQVLRLQAEETGLPRDEKLMSLTLLDSNFSPLTTTLSLRLQLTALDGITSALSLNL